MRVTTNDDDPEHEEHVSILHCSSLHRQLGVLQLSTYGVSQCGESFWERSCLPLNALPVITSHVHAPQTRSICRSGQPMDYIGR
jgi:hypothetical protein